MTDDFSDAPMSIGEIRAAKSNLIRDLTPRDALIDLLRDIDAGKVKITNIFIAHDDEDGDAHYSCAGERGHAVVGIAYCALTRYVTGQ